MQTNAIKLMVLMFVQYAVLTANTRAITTKNYLGLFLTDLVIATLGFSILKKVGDAKSRWDMVAYALGGALGAQFALWLGVKLFG